MRVALWPDCEPEVDAEVGTYFVDGCIGGERHGVFVADGGAGRGLVGFVEVSVHASAPGSGASPVGYVEGWYVAAAHRGGGCGRQLLRAGEGWCRAQGCDTIASDTNEPWATLSVPAHVACGFRVVSGAGGEGGETVRFIKAIGSAGEM
jgi:aminoglycoside 6'-N-acetyltransferase I